MYLELSTSEEHRELVREVMGGIGAEVYETYLKMLQLNEVCEGFILKKGAAADSQLNVELELGTLTAAEENAVVQRKRWQEMRHLMKPEFVEGAPQHLKPVLSALRDNVYDTVTPLAKLRDDVLITYKALQRHLVFSNSRSRYEHRDHSAGGAASHGIMKDTLLREAGQQNQVVVSATDNYKIDKLFQEDEDYKLRMASQYDMLSYVGSDIDEVKMDHFTFFKIFHSLPKLEENLRFDQVIELDSKQSSLLLPVSHNEENLLGINNVYNSTGPMRGLAYMEQMRTELKHLVGEAHMQLASRHTAGLVTRVLADTFELLSPRTLVSLLITDYDLYR